MNIIAVCNTPYQLMCVINLRVYCYPNDAMDVVVSDHILQGRSLVDRISQMDLFRHSYYVESFDYCRRLGKYTSNYALSFGSRDLNHMLNISEIYDLILVSNVDPFADKVYEKCLKLNNKVKVYAYEDAYSTYSDFCGVVDHYRGVFKHSKTYRVGKILGHKWTSQNIEKLYLFSPEKLTGNPSFEVLSMPKINADDDRMKNILNQAFGYNPLEDSYDEKYIFFEESHRREGGALPDVLLLEIIASWVGKENILVKHHPRSDNPFFEKLGYKTNKNTAIPWEVVCMNMENLSEKVLITISSGSVSMPYLLLNRRVHAVILSNLLYGVGTDGMMKYWEWLYENIYKCAPQCFYIPNTLGELNDYFTKHTL